MDILDALFFTINSESVRFNPFETKEINDAYNNFADKYIYTTKELQPQQNDIFECFADTLSTERENAFKVGFRTAIKLIFAK